MGDDEIVHELEELPLAPLVPVDSGLIHAAPTAEVQAVQDAYRALCEALLDDSDYQTIGDKRFRKKSGWRKLAVAFNVSTELLNKTEIRGHRNRIQEVECVVRAIAPNGRYMDGIGVASIYERCCHPDTCKRWERYQDGNPTGHVHCGDNCAGWHHFSNAAHDIPSTAMTRATNRAQSDLFGMGEVSAEEIMDNGNWTPGETARGGSDHSPSSRSRRTPGTPPGPKLAQESQLARIEALAAELKMTDADRLELLRPHTQPDGTLLFSDARTLIDTLETRKREQHGNAD